MASSYPYPSEFNVREFVPELNENNYFEWKGLMLRFIERRGLTGFIDGSVEAPPPPPKRVPVVSAGGGGGGGGGEEIEISNEEEEEDYRSWERSDVLLRGWILTTLPKDILNQVLPRQTSKEVWRKLEITFDPAHALQFDEESVFRLSHYQSLQIATIKDDWESTIKFIEQEPDAARAPINILSETALIAAVRLVRKIHFVKLLVEKIAPEDLAIADFVGLTALHTAARVNNIEAAKLLVNKNPNLPNVSVFDDLILPLHYAAKRGSREMVLYLLDVTRETAELKPFEGKSGAQLLCDLASSGLYDIALTVLLRYPELACTEEPSPLMAIAKKRSSFRSGTPLNFWQKLIYTNVPTKLENIADHHSGGDIENGGNISVKQRLRAMFWEVAEKLVPSIKLIREKKLIHHQATELLKFICTEVAKTNFSKAARILTPALLKATSVGIHEIVEEILESCPSAIGLINPKNQTILQYAIVCRRENVFNLVYQLEESNWFLLLRQDSLGNNSLHLAGCLGPQQQLGLRAGAALQMQRELQWFKEVEKFALPGDKEERNADGMTPAEVFTVTHKELVKEGERWMKETTNSFTIVAALIGTMVFAAAITVPGGNNDKSGHPYFFKQEAFIIFAVSDALALFSSIIFVVMFLSILTSRYAEDDFLYSLPNRLIIGLVTLFVSISSTMIAFGAILYLVCGNNRTWILIPIVALASLPLILFVYLQLPLFVEMVKSTYGGGIFGRMASS